MKTYIPLKFRQNKTICMFLETQPPSLLLKKKKKKYPQTRQGMYDHMGGSVKHTLYKKAVHVFVLSNVKGGNGQGEWGFQIPVHKI